MDKLAQMIKTAENRKAARILIINVKLSTKLTKKESMLLDRVHHRLGQN